MASRTKSPEGSDHRPGSSQDHTEPTRSLFQPRANALLAMIVWPA
jgi:hypothetical protein